MKKSSLSDPKRILTVVFISFFLIFAIISLLFILHSEMNPDYKGPTEDPKSPYFSVPLPYAEEVSAASKKYSISKERIFAVILVESSFQSDAVSSAGAVGLMQMLPSTYEELCLSKGVPYLQEDLKNPSVNIDSCTAYLADLYRMLGDWDLAHIAYNAGIGNVRKWLSDPECSNDGKTLRTIPYPSVAIYLDRIHTAMDAYTKIMKV